MQQPAALKILERGYHLVVTDRDPHCVASQYANELVELDTFDVEGNLRAAARIQKKYALGAVLTVAADCHETVAHVARAAQVPGLDPAISHACRYKGVTREILFRARIPQPRFSLVETIDQARHFMQDVKGPIVLKASDNSGSRGFALIRDPEELDGATFERARAAGTTGRVVVEARLEPLSHEIAEQSVETLWYDGKMYWLNWVDRLFRKDFTQFESLRTGRYDNLGWGVELGHINPAIHSHEIKRRVLELVYQAGVAVGMGRQTGGHVLKADIMLTDQGPYVLEITPRLSGGWDSSASTPARGADFIGGAVSLALGERLDLDAWHRYFEYQDPELFAAVVAEVAPGATDCIGRTFAIGTAYQREAAVENAIRHLSEKTYVV